MKKLGNKLAATFLAAATVVTFIPGVGTQPVNAQSGDPAMNLGAKVLEQKMNTSAAETVCYGRKTWRVIGYNHKGAASEDGAATLLADGTFGQTAYGDSYGDQSGYYVDSNLKKKVDAAARNLTEGEQGAVIKRNLKFGAYWGPETDSVAGVHDIPNTILWPLSIKEANQVNKDLRILDKECGWEQGNHWWLRSRGYENEYMAFVSGYGRVEIMSPVKDPAYGVRPAFYLNLKSVLFTSAAENGKVSGTGGNPLKAQADQTNKGKEWKVTVRDRAHSGFSILEASNTEKDMTITYNAAVPGRRQYISAIITDKPITDPSAKITYYGRLIRCTLPSGTFTFNTGGKLKKGDNLYLFNEQCNGDNMTDYASGLRKVTVK